MARHGKKKSGAGDSLPFLYKCLGLTPVSACANTEAIDDVVFVAIDLEYIENVKQQLPGHEANCQVGVALLDNKYLVLPFSESPISTYNFIAGSPSYCEKAAERFLFGEAVTIGHPDICSKLEALIPRERSIVLVGHAFEKDSRTLRDLGLDLHTSVVGTFDTQKIAAEIIPGRPAALCTTLETLDCPFENLHNAGNDAHFTLQALLAAAVKLYSCGATIDVDCQDRMIALKAIMQDPVRERVNHEGIALKTIPRMSYARPDLQYDMNWPKTLKRKVQGRNNQARSRSPATIERLRAERAKRKAGREGSHDFAGGQNVESDQGGKLKRDSWALLI